MPSLYSLALLPPTLLSLLLPLAVADPNPTAIRKLPPDSNEKLFPEHLAFAPLPDFPSSDNDRFPSLEPTGLDGLSAHNVTTPRLHLRAFARHFDDESHENVLRRAAEALAILERRSSCPVGMGSCADTGSPNKCCQEGTYCTDVPDTDVGHVACCPSGSKCGGGVGKCPSNAVSCPSDLGGGCCQEGYICQGVGCVRPGSPSTSVARPTETTIKTVTSTEEQDTTWWQPSSTKKSKQTKETDTATRTGAAPWRPTITGSESNESTQSGCPTGFYGCLATHGGGCCQTDRNCDIHSCPAHSSTTIATGHATVVVQVDDVPSPTTETCANGWFMCGKSGGPTAGCCPKGYECGTASCFSAASSQTGRVQKEFPDDGAGSALVPMGGLLAAGLGIGVALVWAI